MNAETNTSMHLEKKALLSSSIASAISKAISWISSLWIATVISDSLGESHFAAYALVLSIAAMGSILDLGSIATFAEFAAKTQTKEFLLGSPLFRYACRRITKSVAFFAVISSGLLLLAYQFYPDYADYQLVAYSLLALIIASMAQVSSLIQRVYANQLKEYRFTFLLSTAAVVTTVFVVILAKYLHVSGAKLAIITIAGTSMISIWLCTRDISIVLAAFTRKSLTEPFDLATSFDLFSFKIVLLSVSGLVAGALDTVLVAHFLDVSDVGRHGFGYRLFLGVALAQLSINQLWPILSRRWQGGDRKTRLRIISKVYGFSLLIGIIAAIGTIVCVILFQNSYFPIGIRYSISELTALGILGVSAGLGGVSLALCTREKLLSQLVTVNCIYCVISLPLKYYGSQIGALGGFLWGAAFARVIFYDVPIIALMGWSLSKRQNTSA